MNRLFDWSIAIPVALVGFLVFGLLIIFLGMVVKAWHEVRTSPRESMLLCDVHGPLKKTQTITFVNQPYCALCWFSKFRGERMNHR